jgi:diketogulonate reductase-like aldo/keto reductase
MQRRPFGRNGPPVPVVGLGTWMMEKLERRRAVDVVRAALDEGLTHVDTAELYGEGKVEEILGDALAGRRDEVFLVSKVRPQNASREGTVRACERSLRRLRTDRLDCYLLHWESRHPLAETVAAFEQLRAAGKIRSYGVSNFDERRVEETVHAAGPGRVACNQVFYHLGERGIEHAVLPTCEKHGIAVVGYSPFSHGGLPDAGSAAGRVLAAIAAGHEATPHQVALAFLVRRPPLFAIPMTSRADHARDNALAGDLLLDDDDLRRLEQVFPLGPRRKGVATV